MTRSFAAVARRFRPGLAGLETRIVLDAAYTFAAAIGDTAPAADFSYARVQAQAVGADAAGDVYVAGNFMNVVHFGAGPNAPTLESPGDPTSFDIYIAKYSASGTLLWDEALQPSSTGAVQLGSNFDADTATPGMAGDSAGDVFLTGTLTNTVNVNPVSGSPTNLSSSDGALLLMKLAPDGTLDFAENFGGASPLDSGNALALDTQGHILLTGTFGGQDANFNPGSGQSLLSTGGDLANDMYVASFNSDGSFGWARDIGGAEAGVSGEAITADSSGNLFVTGGFSGTADFDPGSGVAALTASSSGSDIFALKLDPSGNYLWAKAMVQQSPGYTNGLNTADSIATDPSGNIYFAGAFENEVDFDPGPGTDLITAFGEDGYVEKLDSAGNFKWAQSTGNSPGDEGDVVAVDTQGQVFVAGTTRFLVPTNIVPGPQNVGLETPNQGEYFVMRLDTQGQLQGVRTATYSPAVGDAIGGQGSVYGLATTPTGSLALVGGYTNGPATFGATSLPQLTYRGGQISEQNVFVAVTTPIPNAPTGATLAFDPSSNTGTPSSANLTDQPMPTFDVSGVAAGAEVTLNASYQGSTFTVYTTATRVGPGPITVSSPSSALDFPGLSNGTWVFSVASNDPAGGVGVVSNSVTIQFDTTAPSIVDFVSVSNSDGTAVINNTTKPQPIVSGLVSGAYSVDLLDAAGSVLASSLVSNVSLGLSTYSVKLPASLRGTVELFTRARSASGVTSPLSSPISLTISTNTSSGGGSSTGSGGGSATSDPIVHSVTIASVQLQKHKPKVKVFRVLFTGTIDPSTIGTSAYYTIRSAGRDRRFGTKDDRTLSFKTSFSASQRIVTIQTAQKLSLAYPLELTINGLLSTGPDIVFFGPKAKS
jgi:Beta-propeller repeat